MITNKLAKADFLGRGLGFPPTFTKSSLAGGDIVMVEGALDIQQSLQILLSTRPGERVLQPDFGCNLDTMLFEPLTLSLLSLMQNTVKTAIIRHEPRIIVNDVRMNASSQLEGSVMIQVDYTIRSNNSRFNFVFPFYIQEGTDVGR
jgi:phage baseplate assembly protein W